MYQEVEQWDRGFRAGIFMHWHRQNSRRTSCDGESRPPLPLPFPFPPSMLFSTVRGKSIGPETFSSDTSDVPPDIKSSRARASDAQHMAWLNLSAKYPEPHTFPARKTAPVRYVRYVLYGRSWATVGGDGDGGGGGGDGGGLVVYRARRRVIIAVENYERRPVVRHCRDRPDQARPGLAFDRRARRRRRSEILQSQK